VVTLLPFGLTSFVGREPERAELRTLVIGTRLLTLVGTGGSGKTRLAVEVARELGDRDGFEALFVDLTPAGPPVSNPAKSTDFVGTPLSLAGFVLGSLELGEEPGVTAIDRLARALDRRKLILLLDSCEHVLAEARDLASELLGRCPGLHVVATSREALGAEREVAWPVPPLALPPGTDAIGLLVERARLVKPAFEVSDRNRAAVAELCRALDGLPLAIELAAAWVRVMEPDEILARLRADLGLLESFARIPEPRHRTLRAAFDWSFALLDEPLQRLLRRLAVFAGPFDSGAARAVCGEAGVEELLDALVAKSMVTRHPTWTRRFRLLDTVRQFALEHLAAAGQVEELRGRHLAHFLALAEEADAQEEQAGPNVWLEVIPASLDDLRLALEWSRRAGSELQLRLAACVAWFLITRGHLEEAAGWLDGALASHPRDDGLLARGLNVRAWVAWRRGEIEAAGRSWRAALDLLRPLGPSLELADTLVMLGEVAAAGGDWAAAEARYREGLAMAREVDNPRVLVNALSSLGWLEALRGTPDRGVALLEEAVGVCRARASRQLLAAQLLLRAMTAVELGDGGTARESLGEALAISLDHGFRHGIGSGLLVFAALEVAEGRPRRALVLAGAGASVFASTGGAVSPLLRPRIEAWLDRARAVLPAKQVEAALRTGAELDAEEAIAEAQTPATPAPSPLTPRQQQMAELVADGATNRAIAAALGISVRTVEVRIGQVMDRLQLQNRAQIAAWVAEWRRDGGAG
jgi:predicted ATPase/DNA-binding CsgD family transcriptional regulator